MSRRLFEELYINGRAYPQIMSSVQTMHAYTEALRRRMPQWSERTLRMAFAEMKFADRWIASGQVVYNLSHSMAAMFSITSAPPLDWKRTPHEAFVIVVPRRFLPVAGSFAHDYSYIYACQEGTLLVPDWDTTATMIVQYGNISSREGLEVSEPAEIAARLREQAEKFCGKQAEQLEINLVEFKRLMPGLSDADALVLAQRATEGQKDELLRTAKEATTYDAKSIGQKVLLNRFVSNVVAYVTEHRPALTTCRSADADESGTRLLATLAPPVEVVVDRAFRDAAGAAVDAILTGSTVGIRRALAHHVRGHWRDQPCGAGRAERRRIWIMPHRRGDESLGSVMRRVEQLDLPMKVN